MGVTKRVSKALVSDAPAASASAAASAASPAVKTEPIPVDSFVTVVGVAGVAERMPVKTYELAAACMRGLERSVPDLFRGVLRVGLRKRGKSAIAPLSNKLQRLTLAQARLVGEAAHSEFVMYLPLLTQLHTFRCEVAAAQAGLYLPPSLRPHYASPAEQLKDVLARVEKQLLSEEYFRSKNVTCSYTLQWQIISSDTGALLPVHEQAPLLASPLMYASTRCVLRAHVSSLTTTQLPPRATSEGQFCITVDGTVGKTFELNVNGDTTTLDIKKQIETISGVSLTRHCLILRGIAMPNAATCTLRSEHVLPGVMLLLLPERETNMQIFVRLDNKLFSLDADPADSVLHVKRMMEQKQGYFAQRAVTTP